MSVLLKDIFPLELLATHIENGVVRKQIHPQFPTDLYILNYSEQAQFGRIWDVCTTACRGLIVGVDQPDGFGGEANDFVVARGFNKFHNLNTAYVPETMEENLPKDTPLVTQKLDGSLGVLYRWADMWRIATRGSFASDQATWATAWLQSRKAGLDKHQESLDLSEFSVDDFTPVFEIIYQANRIVVDYDFEGLVLLSLINNRTGAEVPRDAVEDWGTWVGLPVVERFHKSLLECAAEDKPNEEGYVLTYSNGVKVKVKFVEYCRLHRILTGMNPRAIWELLDNKAHDTIHSLLQDEKMPDSFKKWFSGWVSELKGRYTALETEAQAVFASRPMAGSRKDIALHFQQTPHLCSILFALLDDKDFESVIWARLRPKAIDTYKRDGE